MVPSRSRNSAGVPAAKTEVPIRSTHRPGSSSGYGCEVLTASLSAITEARFDHFAQMMIEAQMPLLDDRRRGRGHVEQDVGERCKLAASVAGQADHRHAHHPRLF